MSQYLKWRHFIMKKKLRESILYIRLIRPLIHFLLIMISFYGIYKLRSHTDLIPFIRLRIPVLNLLETNIFALISWIIFVIIWAFNWIYKLFKPIHGYYKKFIKTWMIWLIWISFISYFWYGFFFVNGISRFVLIRWWISSWLLITIFDIIINIVNSKLEKKTPYKIKILYTNIKFYERIAENFEWYKIYETSWVLLEEDHLPDLSDADIILTIWSLEKGILQKIVDYTRLNEKDYYSIPTSYFLDDLIYTPERLWPILAFEYKPSPLDWRFRVLKRLFDIIFCSIFLLLFWWVYLLIAVFIYINDWWPVIYKSIRTWKWWKPFSMYKFRSMVKNAEKLKEKLINQNERKWPLFKITNDPRILFWWKLLRKTSLDELPQIINILKWDMSVVWPRPHLPEEVEKYTWWQKRLLSIKPWITWYSQIFGRDRLDFDEEAKLDLYYIQNWNIFLDIYVIVSTIKVVFDWK